MNFKKYGLMLILIAVVVCCQKEKIDQAEELSHSASEATTGSANNLPAFDADYLTSIYEKQELIKMEPENIELRKAYCQAAYLKDQRFFVSMGIAAKHNPTSNQPIPASLVERAAKLDAIRWAGYGQTWLNNNYMPAFGKLNIKFERPLQIIDRANVGDSLFLFIATTIDQSQ